MSVKAVHLCLAAVVAAAATCVDAARALPLALSPRETAVSFTAPWFCHELDCPPYEVVDDGVGIEMELRHYAAGRWVATNVTGVSYDLAIKFGFLRLFDYIQGQNDAHMKIEMTAPVRALLTPGAGPFCKDEFTIAFYLPAEFQNSSRNAPAPDRDDTFLQSSEEVYLYVISYPGFANEASVLSKGQELIRRLQDIQADFDASTYYAAGYDPPYRLINRHNEVWVTALDTDARVQQAKQTAARKA